MENTNMPKTRLQKARLDKGYSQSELAIASGIPLRRIQHYEQQSRPIERARLDTLCALCIALDCGIEDILDEKETIAKYKMVK